MVSKSEVIDKLQEINTSEDFIKHIENVDRKDLTIVDRTFKEYENGDLDKIRKRVPESAYEV